MTDSWSPACVQSHEGRDLGPRYCCNVNSSAAAPVRLAADLLLSTREGFKHSANDYDLVVYVSLFQNDVRLYLKFPLEKKNSLFIYSARRCVFASTPEGGSYIGVACSIFFVVWKGVCHGDKY